MKYKNIIKQIILSILFLSIFTNNVYSQTYEQQQKLQEYFDLNNKVWGFSKQVLDEVFSERKEFFGNYADALLAIDLANKFANAQDKELLETIVIEASKKGMEKIFPNMASVLGWASWAKTGMELLDQFVVNPARMGSSLDDYYNKREAGWDRGDAISTVRDWGNVLWNLKKDFRKQYGDAAFEEISPSTLELIPRWDDKFNRFVEAWFEGEYIKYKVKKEAGKVLKSKNKELSKGEKKLLKWLEKKQKELDKEKDCEKNEHWDAEEGDCECNEGYKEDENRICLEDKEVKVSIELTYPAGQSPKVFTSGWVFGAYATVKIGDEPEKNISDQVQWSGSGSFTPEQGSISRPTFSSAGRNTIVLKVTIDDQTFKEKFKVKAVDPILGGYMGIGDNAYCPSDAHGCPADPHVVQGPILTGSPNVTVGGRPAARKGDVGSHAACCGPNTFKIDEGDPNVLINGKPAARRGDKTIHCGGTGKLIGGAFNLDCGTNQKWDDASKSCVCEDGYEKNEDDVCIKKKEDHDCKDNEEWSEDKKDCVCKEGFTANKKGNCIKIKDCNENEHFNVEKDDCECDDGFTPNKKGDCVEIKDCSGENEHFDADIGDCDCDDGFAKNDKNKCVAEVADDMCSMGHINSLVSRIGMLIAENKSNESLLLSYIRKFEKEINDQSSDPCANSIVAYSYYNAMAIAARMDANVSDIYDMSVEIVWLQAICPDLDEQMAGKGITIKSLVSSISGVGSYKNKIPQMTSRLREYGCDEDEVREDGEKVVPPEGDPGFIQDGGISTEMPGDGDDNDGDGQQDEEVRGLSGYNVTLVLYDSGSAADDVFSLSVTGYGNLGQTPAGGLRSYGLNLLPGSYTAVVSVVLAPDDVGTYTLTVLYNGESIGSITGSPPQGSSATLTFTVPSE